MENTLSRKIYDFLVTRDLAPEIASGRQSKPETDPAKAELFSFDWIGPSGRNYGTVVILINPDTGVELYTADNLGRTMLPEDKDAWLGSSDNQSAFIPDLKRIAVSSMNTSDHAFNIININRLKYNMQGIAAIREGLFEGYYGKKNISYSDQPQHTRIMIRHNRDLQEGEPRYRAIESLFVENAAGERFRVPSRNLMHGRMMARHIAEGGTPYDAFGQHINTIMEELMTLSRFIRASRGRELNEAAQNITVEAGRHYHDLKAKARRMISQRGYREARDQFDPAEARPTEPFTDHIREMFVQNTLDERIEAALPVLARLKGNRMREADEFESWAHRVTEETWSWPETPEKIEALRQLLIDPLPVGANAINATEQLSDVLGDDELFDRLTKLAQQDADADARATIIARLAELGVDLDIDISVVDSGQEPIQPGMEENLSPDGVLMTQGPNPTQFESSMIDLDQQLSRLRRLLI